MYRTAILSLALALVASAAGCLDDETALAPAPTLLGFGDETGTVELSGDTTVVRVYWTRATEAPRELSYVLSGDGATAEDLVALTPSPVAVPAGATEVDLLFRAASAPNPARVDRTGVVVLPQGDWYRLSERDTFAFVYNLENTVDLSVWADGTAFPQLYGYTSGSAEPVPQTGRGPSAGEHFALAHASRTEPNVIGMFNTTEGLSTNALRLHSVYADQDVSSGSADIRIPSLFRLIPDGEGAKTGRVEVIEQRVAIRRKDSSDLPGSFTVGISGGGRYDETTGILTADVLFDESELGVTEPVLRRYQYESERRGR